MTIKAINVRNQFKGIVKDILALRGAPKGVPVYFPRFTQFQPRVITRWVMMGMSGWHKA